MKVMKGCFLLLLAFSAGTPFAAYAQDRKFEYEFDHEKPWVELQSQLPPYPSQENLLKFDAGTIFMSWSRESRTATGTGSTCA